MKQKRIALFTTLMVVLTFACGGGAVVGSQEPGSGQVVAPKNSLNIMADYQVQTAYVDSGVLDYCKNLTGVTVNMTGASSTSVRVANDAQKTSKAYDAYWATSSLFLPYLPVQAEATAKTYMVIGAYPEVGQKLGWDENNLGVRDVLGGIPDGTVKLATTNMSQSDPGASFFIAATTSLTGETMLTQEGLDSKLPVDQVKAYFANLRHATDSVATLKTEIIDDRVNGTGKYNTYVLYEATAIQINKELVARGLAPMHIYYLSDATVATKFPIVFTGGAETKDAFKKFLDCARGDEANKKLQAIGYRTSLLGLSMPNADKAVFNPEWGIVTTTERSLMDYPQASVASSALALFQVTFKPKLRAGFCFDDSGSMYSNGGKGQLADAVGVLFDQAQATKHGVQIGPDDAYTVFVFDSANHSLGTVYGADPGAVTTMAQTIKNASFGGGTAMFDCVHDAVDFLVGNPSGAFYDPNYPAYDPNGYVYAVYVMTDGETNQGWSKRNFEDYYNTLPADQRIKVYGVGFGSVDMNRGPFVEMITLTGGVLKDGRSNLVEALKLLFSNY